MEGLRAYPEYMRDLRDVAIVEDLLEEGAVMLHVLPDAPADRVSKFQLSADWTHVRLTAEEAKWLAESLVTVATFVGSEAPAE